MALPFGRSAAVAAHCRHDKGLGPQMLEMFDNRPGDFGDIRNAPAAGGYGHALARPDFFTQIQGGKLPMHLGRDVLYARGVEPLPQAKYFRKIVGI